MCIVIPRYINKRETVVQTKFPTSIPLSHFLFLEAACYHGFSVQPYNMYFYICSFYTICFPEQFTEFIYPF